MPTQLIGPARIYTLAGLPLRGPLPDAALEVLENAGVAIDTETGIIEEAGDWQALLARYPEADIKHLEEPCTTLFPAWVDCHTHAIFSGNRARDMALRNAGATYQQMAAEGGGIKRTMHATRSLSAQESAERATHHLHARARQGIAVVEAKTGYGLTIKDEGLQISVLDRLSLPPQAAGSPLAANGLPLVYPTLLAAHTVPPEYEGRADKWLADIVECLFPLLTYSPNPHKPRVDIFIEPGTFTLAQGRWYLEQAKAHGLEFTVHGDQFTPGSARLACELGALSVDHLEATTDSDIAFIASSGTVAVALPAASLGLGVAFTPARKLLNAGACLALASDYNPGSAWSECFLQPMQYLANQQKLTCAEVLAGITFRACAALEGLPKLTRWEAGDRHPGEWRYGAPFGRIAPGYLANFYATACNHEEIVYFAPYGSAPIIRGSTPPTTL